MRNVRTLVTLLVLSMVFTACGGAAAPAAAPPTQPIAAPTSPRAAAPTAAPVAGPVTIRVFAPQEPSDKGMEYSDLPTNSLTKELEAKFNVHFEWQLTSFDGAAAKQKRLTAFASGDEPDLFLLLPWVDTFSPAELIQYGKQGAIVPLNDLIAQYAPNITVALAQDPTLKARATAPDGKIYGMPQTNECYHCSYSYKLWINQQWLQKLHLAMPTTPEELKTVLTAFKTQDPNGNGKADEIPLTGTTATVHHSPIPFLMNAFIYDDGATYLTVQDGTVDLAANKPEWKQGLAYIKSLYAAGLIDPQAFTQTRDALLQRSGSDPASLLGVVPAVHPGEFSQIGSASSNAFVALPPLQGAQGGYATYEYPSPANATFVLTRKASTAAQIAAIKMLDYFFTPEGQIRGYLGEEGVDWRKPQPGDVAIEPKATPLFATIDAPKHNAAWGALTWFNLTRSLRDGWAQATDASTPAGFERRLQEATHLYDGKQPKELFPYWLLWPDPAVMDEVTRLRTSLNEYIEQNALLFVSGVKDLDRDWDAYVQELDRLGLARYLALMQQAYDASAR